MDTDNSLEMTQLSVLSVLTITLTLNKQQLIIAKGCLPVSPKPVSPKLGFMVRVRV